MSTDMITAAAKEEFTVSLKSIATAGYVWKVESLPDAVQFLGKENERRGGQAKPGDSTHQIFRFRANKKGEYQILFRLARPWETSAIDIKTVTVNVT